MLFFFFPKCESADKLLVLSLFQVSSVSACQLLFVVERSAHRRRLWHVLFCKRPESPVIHREKGAQHEPGICAFKKKKGAERGRNST